MNQQVTINPKASLRVFNGVISLACQKAGIGVEDWQTQHIRTLRAELGKMDWKDGKAGILNIGKGCSSARTSQAKGVALDGKAAHPSIRFQREADVATSYVAEFEGVAIGMTEGSATYVKLVAARVAELAKEAAEKSTQNA